MLTRINRNEDERNRVLRSVCRSLVEYGYVFTTKARAKSAQRVIERLITKVKKDDLHNMRLANRFFNDMSMVKRLQERVSKIENRNGGYTRLNRFSLRKGDNALLMALRFIDVF